MTAQEALEAFVVPPRSPRERPRETEFLDSGANYSLRLGPGGYARGGGDTIQVYTWGSGGPTALLVHGWGERAGRFEGWVQPLLDAGWRVVAFDAPAHGRSGGVLCSAPAVAAAMLAVAEREGSPRAVVAHSLGVVAASIAQRRGLSAERAVLLAACCWVRPVLEEFARRLALSDEVTAELMKLATEEFPTDDSSAEANAPYIEGLQALLMHDPEDQRMSYRNSAAIAASWPGAVLQPFAGVGHRQIVLAPEVIAAGCDFLK